MAKDSGSARKREELRKHLERVTHEASAALVVLRSEMADDPYHVGGMHRSMLEALDELSKAADLLEEMKDATQPRPS